MEQGYSTNDLIKKGSESLGLGKSGKIRALLMLVTVGIVGFLIWKAILPHLLQVVWDTVSLAIGAGILLMILGFAVANRRNFVHFHDMIADKLFGRIIKEAPFLMQQKQIKLAKENLEAANSKVAIVEGRFVLLRNKIIANEQAFNEAKEGEILAKKAQDDELLRKQQRKQQNAYRYIQAVGPTVKNLGELLNFSKSAVKMMAVKIGDAEADLETNRDIFDAVVTGADSVNLLKKAMVGDAVVNSEAQRAQLEVMRTIALSVGQTKAAMEIISDVTRTANLEDSAKLATARKQLEALNVVDISQLPIDNRQLVYSGIKKIDSNEFPID